MIFSNYYQFDYEFHVGVMLFPVISPSAIHWVPVPVAVPYFALYPGSIYLPWM
jgi:hypothetical protein